MACTAEMLAALSDMDLDDLVEETVMDREPEPGWRPWLRRRVVKRYGQLRGRDDECPAYTAVTRGWAW